MKKFRIIKKSTEGLLLRRYPNGYIGTQHWALFPDQLYGKWGKTNWIADNMSFSGIEDMDGPLVLPAAFGLAIGRFEKSPWVYHLEKSTLRQYQGPNDSTCWIQDRYARMFRVEWLETSWLFRTNLGVYLAPVLPDIRPRRRAPSDPEQSDLFTAKT